MNADQLALEALTKITDALDKLGNMPDSMVSPGAWSAVDAERRITEAREAIAALSAHAEPVVKDCLTTAQAEPANVEAKAPVEGAARNGSP